MVRKRFHIMTFVTFLSALFLLLNISAQPRCSQVPIVKQEMPPIAAPDSFPASSVGVDVVDRNDLLQFTAGGHVLGFRQGEMYLASSDHSLKIEFVGAQPVSPLETTGSSSTSYSSQKTKPLGTVSYPDLWGGISLVYQRDSQGLCKSTYHIAPGTRRSQLEQIRLAYNVPVDLDNRGQLVLTFETGQLIESAPIAWQEIGGKRLPVEVSFCVLGQTELGFNVGTYDPSFPLVIDPVISWKSFIGSTLDDFGQAIAIDNSGNLYITGQSAASWGLPVNAYYSHLDAFVAKLNSNGAVLWNTFMGSEGNDYGYGIALDGSGNIYVLGSSNFSWGSPLNPHSGGVSDVFIAKLDSSGTLLWNTFMRDSGGGIAVDGSGNIYVTGRKYLNAFVAKLNSGGTLLWNTFLGSDSGDAGKGITVDGSGNIYITGISGHSWGSPVNPYSGGPSDVFVAKLDSSGSLLWNTFMGSEGDDNDYGFGITLDGSGNIYVLGSSNFSWGSPVNPYSAGYDAFVAKLSSSGALLWNTFMGSDAGNDYGFGIALDGSGSIYVVGRREGWKGFAAKLNNGGTLLWNTFMGYWGSTAQGITVDSSDNVYVTGFLYGWRSVDDPGLQWFDAFVYKIVPGTNLKAMPCILLLLND